MSDAQATGNCPTCEKDVEVEPVEEGEENMVMCLDCGEEFVLLSEQAKKYANYAVGVIQAAEPIKGGNSKLTVEVGGDAPLTIVTNAKHMDAGAKIIIAKEGAVVPAGASVDEDPNALTIAPTAVSGVKSFGMVCDAPMLGWTGGAKGVAQKLGDDFKAGDLPPMERPR
mmetsp:Transcript_13606/g.24241  ORF Transcript_13606/g.24241 Transcript_13606/m.24241 type:complete len:169 (+) Transcript_13606:93-599(+)|eukprot:CAMPEP_0184517766 /NCGR_PEP_ID=MMETSP0198_2-20121128/5729_1 /TAXON_ID=1112570 /ORGANISM="Thraustochytrium sp., Strain LLF1b" /LENGTH=168 /DNA_ID=CAMNT_0026908159 /DNA_START=582 /DNA_END=1088 /DNA_ORIENTATION=+